MLLELLDNRVEDVSRHRVDVFDLGHSASDQTDEFVSPLTGEEQDLGVLDESFGDVLDLRVLAHERDGAVGAVSHLGNSFGHRIDCLKGVSVDLVEL